MQDAKLKLNLGSGDMPLDGFINLDRKTGGQVYPLVAYADNSVDEIRASHILEHFGRRETLKVLTDWVARLRPGGVLKVAVPDFARIAERYVKGDNLDFAGFVFGGQVDDSDFHKAFFDEKGLKKTFEILGLTEIGPWVSEAADCASYPISLNLQGTKTGANQDWGDVMVGFTNEAAKPLLTEFALKRRNIYSQNGEDGIIDAIFDKIGTKNKWCLEVGASDGIMFSNTRRLVEVGWNAILIEKDPEKYERLVKNCENYPNVKTFNLEIGGKNTLDLILARCNAPEDIDLCVIDIDGQDWHVWNQMIRYRPRVMCIEYLPDVENPEFIPAVGGDGQAGRAAIQKLAAGKLYHNSVVTKYNVIALRNIIEEEEIKEVEKDVKTFAVMSMPRLTFTDNMFSAIRSLIPLGINLEKGTGVFWGQVLTRLIEMHTDDGTDYILTVDYDTYFTKNQVIRLLQLMQEYPEADAIVPLQIKRECDFPLIGRIDETKKVYTQIDTAEFEKELMPITTGHFGLTIFRVESLKKLKKPWFFPRTDPNGSWHDGRQDEDIYFWHNFAESGLQAFLAPKIGLPHLELMATIPGRLQDGFKPIYYHVTDLDKKGLPDWCEPKVELLK